MTVTQTVSTKKRVRFGTTIHIPTGTMEWADDDDESFDLYEDDDSLEADVLFPPGHQQCDEEEGSLTVESLVKFDEFGSFSDLSDSHHGSFMQFPGDLSKTLRNDSSGRAFAASAMEDLTENTYSESESTAHFLEGDGLVASACGAHGLETNPDALLRIPEEEDGDVGVYRITVSSLPEKFASSMDLNAGKPMDDMESSESGGNVVYEKVTPRFPVSPHPRASPCKKLNINKANLSGSLLLVDESETTWTTSATEASSADELDGDAAQTETEDPTDPDAIHAMKRKMAISAAQKLALDVGSSRVAAKNSNRACR